MVMGQSPVPQVCLDILERFGMADCKPISTPMQPNTRLTRSQSPQTPEEVQFMKSIPYLAGQDEATGS